MKTEVKIKVQKLVAEIGDIIREERFLEKDVNLLKDYISDQFEHYLSASKDMLLDDIITEIQKIDETIEYVPYIVLIIDGFRAGYYDYNIRQILSDIDKIFDVDCKDDKKKETIKNSFSKFRMEEKNEALISLYEDLLLINNNRTTYAWGDDVFEPVSDGTYILYYHNKSNNMGWVKLNNKN